MDDRFRNHIRDFWRRNTHGVGELAQRLLGPRHFQPERQDSCGERELHHRTRRVLRDLVTYNVKHNGANGESNRDGSDDNRSWNCGVEGETDDEAVNALRHRQART